MPSMLTIFRFHTKSCPHRADGRSWRRCKCPIHVQGTLEGVTIRESLGTRNWDRATAITREWEAVGVKTETEDASIAKLHEAFTADLKRRKVTSATQAKYGVLFDRLEAWAGEKGYTHVKQINLSNLREHVGAWPDAAITQTKNLERLRCVFRFANESDWISSNPAAGISMPTCKPNPTLPYEREEMAAIIEACSRFPSSKVGRGLPVCERIKSLALLMRYSGLRISDAVSCGVARLDGNRLFLYTQKTGTPVYVPLPPMVCEELAACPRSNPNYWFWSGKGTVESCRKYWDKKLRKLFGLAGVAGAHSHRFRDTFAVEQLNAGTEMAEVSIMLGHSSVRITEKHYAPWVKSRQQKLEAAVSRAWANDPLIQERKKVVEMRRTG